MRPVPTYRVDSCSFGLFAICAFGLLIGLVAIILVFVVLYFLFYAAVSFVANWIKGRDPEPSPGFWSRVSLAFSERDESAQSSF